MFVRGQAVFKMEKAFSAFGFGRQKVWFCSFGQVVFVRSVCALTVLHSFLASSFYDISQVFRLRVLVSQAFFRCPKVRQSISILKGKIIWTIKCGFIFRVFTSLKTVDSLRQFCSGRLFLAIKKLGWDNRNLWRYFSATVGGQFCRAFFGDFKTCCFEKHGFQNHKAAANRGFVQVGPTAMGWTFVFQCGF